MKQARERGMIQDPPKAHVNLAGQKLQLGAPDMIAPKKKGKRRREMNATEAEFSLFLEDQKQRGEIIDWEYEGMTLRWDDGMKYTPDFVVTQAVELIVIPSVGTRPHVAIKLIEVKGAFRWQKDVVKFRAARAHWPRYTWEFWQKDAQGWGVSL